MAQFRGITPEKPNAFPVGVVGGAVTFGEATDNLAFNTALLSGSTIRLNSQTDSTSVSGDLIGFQSKPRTGIAGSQTVYGSQISAQISNGIATTGSIIGGIFDTYLRGTAAGTIGGRVSALDLELVTDDAGTRDITGYVTGLRIRKAFSAGTVTGVQSAIRVEFPEVQTGSESYDALFELTGNVGTGATVAWHSTQTSATASGVIGVMVNGAKRYITLTSGTPS